MPAVIGLLHDRFATPYVAVVLMIIVSGIVATVGVLGGVVALTGITLASNLGTFVLYALICGITFVAFAGSKEFHALRHRIIPALGMMLNILMVIAIFSIGILSGGTTAQSTYLALGIAVGWLAVSVAYFYITSSRQKKEIILSMNTVASVVSSEQQQQS